MTHVKTLKVILAISIAGILFSGYLSYYELFVPGGCADAIVSCGTSGFTLANLPACVYGLAMYTIIFLLALTSLRRRHE